MAAATASFVPANGVSGLTLPASALAASSALALWLWRSTDRSTSRRLALLAALLAGNALSIFALAYAAAHAADASAIVAAAHPQHLPAASYFFLASLSLGIAAGTVGVNLTGLGLVVAFVEMLLAVSGVAAMVAYVVEKFEGIQRDGRVPSGRDDSAPDRPLHDDTPLNTCPSCHRPL